MVFLVKLLVELWKWRGKGKGGGDWGGTPGSGTDLWRSAQSMPDYGPAYGGPGYGDVS